MHILKYRSCMSKEEIDMVSIDKLYKLVLLLLLATNISVVSSCNLLANGGVPEIEVRAVNALLKLAKGQKKFWNASYPLWDNRTIICGNCNKTFCHVTELHLSGQHLYGRIPQEVGNISRLTILDLSGNHLRGEIPISIINLQFITQIDLSDNSLSGKLPPFQMESLQFLNLGDNKLNGSVPKSFLNLTSLENLGLYENCFTGDLLPFQMNNLQVLYVDGNQLSGSIPQQLGNLTQLVILYLSANHFVGELPPSFMKLVNLENFAAQGNSLSGKIPTFVANWTQLYTLDLLGNNFEGPWPKEISSLKNLGYLALSNVVTRGGAYDFPDLSRMTSLEYLTLRKCSLRGPIPGYIWELKELQYLDLSFNELSGQLPNSISTALTSIFLRENKLNGSLPGWLTKRKNVKPHRYVDVSENLFNITNSEFNAASDDPDVNTFPGCSSNLPYTKDTCDHYCPNNLKYDELFINCGGKEVTVKGHHYYADENPNGSSTFSRDEKGGWGYSSMGLAKIVNKQPESSIIKDTCDLSTTAAVLVETARVAPISLKYYGFCFSSGNYTVKLKFYDIGSSNKQVYPITHTRVFDIDIQRKNVRKNYNIETAEINADGDKIVEYNTSITSHLEIHLYWSGYGSYTQSNGPLISAISVTKVVQPPRKHQLSPALKAVIAVSSLSFLALLLLLLRKLGYLGGKRSSKDELKTTELFPGGVYTFRQIKDATQNFNVVNKLGEGGFGPVYKGVLPDGTTIAVKQLSGKSKQGIREFVNEIGTISALQHPNLVKLMGCCAEDNELLLIYEYMENNSLEHALFGPDEEIKSRLNWPTRVKIILGIAKGLTFLHEESKLKIIHRDIKPTNILLDKDLNAKITDFGYAKLNEGEHTHVITRIAGTLGYMAPEYAMRGYLTPKADIYSFGVVTLEIVSGRNSTSCRPSDQTVYLLDSAYVLQEQGNLMDLVDPKLGTDYSWTEANSILELAMMCTNPSPTLRPTTSDVVKVIEGKTKIKTTSSTVRHSTDEIALTKAMAALSQPSPSESYSTAGPSEATPPISNSNNITNEI
ncbi:probable LRR receptor-like serine/threonine-protein kinase At1g53430 isoform X3 [Solanum pennellii]|uniref:non-specific serine/threonine protein kinase n=1 Tax=Solanum pennellii TaxID=28526 RepID=A0ABM1G4V4_SOLPN|nr:probable LRR receptor-like serine/threonine-protein kinase At1g53430 isoform X3 [Solanum pennellii]